MTTPKSGTWCSLHSEYSKSCTGCELALAEEKLQAYREAARELLADDEVDHYRPAIVKLRELIEGEKALIKPSK